MGRTLHYRVLNQDRLTDEHLAAMLAVSEQFNSGPFANIWTCENFFLDPLASYPNRQREENWESCERRFAELEAAGLPPLAVRRQLLQEGVALRHSEELRGFTKVGGNEYNALLVYAALIEISKRTPAVISLHDEGEFLLCDVLIRRGKARPGRARMEEAIACWEKQGFLKDNQYGCADTAQLFRKLLEQEKRWQRPEKFCRTVRREDFAGHPEYNAGEIMAGFHGEYYGLTGKNPFDESMHALADIFRLSGGKDVQTEVARKPKKQ
jgi:hypothetical protein